MSHVDGGTGEHIWQISLAVSHSIGGLWSTVANPLLPWVILSLFDETTSLSIASGYFCWFFRPGLSFKSKNIFVILDNFGGSPPISASTERDCCCCYFKKRPKKKSPTFSSRLHLLICGRVHRRSLQSALQMYSCSSVPVASPSGGSDDDDDRLLFKENKKVFLYGAAVLFGKKRKEEERNMYGCLEEKRGLQMTNRAARTEWLVMEVLMTMLLKGYFWVVFSFSLTSTPWCLHQRVHFASYYRSLFQHNLECSCSG